MVAGFWVIRDLDLENDWGELNDLRDRVIEPLRDRK